MGQFLQCLKIEAVLAVVVIGVVAEIPFLAGRTIDHPGIEGNINIGRSGQQVGAGQAISQGDRVVRVGQRRLGKVDRTGRWLCLHLDIVGKATDLIHGSDIDLD